MYVDMDCYAFRSLNNSKLMNNFLSKINIYDHILGLSQVNSNFFERFVTNLKLNNAIMISSSYNPVIRDLIKSIITNNIDYKNDRKKSFINSDYKIVHTVTGPIMFNNFFLNLDLKKYKERVYIQEFPFYVFEPGQAFQNYDIKDNTIALHKYEMSWLSSNMKVVVKHYYHSIKPHFLLSIIFLLIIWLIYKYYYKDCKQRCKSICTSLK